MRFEFVTPQIAIGGAQNSQDVYDQMQRHLGGITHIICLTELCQHRFHNVWNAEILHYYLSDDGETKPYRYWAACVEYALDVLENPDNKLLVHCAAGRNRSTSIVYAILLCLGYSSDESIQMILTNYADKIAARDRNYPKLLNIRYQSDVDAFYMKWRTRHEI